MKSFTRLALVILYITWINSSIFAQKPEDYLGKWIGTFTFNSGTEFGMQVEITEADKKSFAGTAIWPDYFNSGSNIEGKMKKGELNFHETNIIQGIEMDLSSDYSLKLIEGKLTGVCINTQGEQIGSISLSRFSDLDTEQVNEWNDFLDKQQQKYGEVIFIEEKPISNGQKIYDQVMQASQMDDIATMLVVGTFKMKGFEMPAKIIKKEKKQFIEMSFQGSKFINCKNDSLEWSYNPIEDNVTVKKLSVKSDGSKETFLDHNLYPDMKVRQYHTVKINGKEGHRLLLNADTILIAFVANNQLVRIEKKEDIMDMGNYEMIDGIDFPKYIRQISYTEDVTINIDEAELNLEVSDSTFLMSEEMKAKISYTENHGELNETGNGYFEQGDYEQALDYYNQAISQNQTNYIYFYNRGFAYLNLKKYYEAITDLSRSIELNNQYPKSWNKRGEAKSKLGDYKNALKDYKHSFHLDTTFEDALLNAGVAHYLLENYDSAAQTFSKLININPQKGLYHYNHAYSLHQLGMDSLSEISFSNAIENDYNGAEAYNMLGISQYRTDQYIAAIKNFAKAITLNSEVPMYALNLGKSYYYADQVDSAISYISLFLESSPKNDDALNFMGLSYLKDKDHQTAISYFTKAIEVNPGNAVYFDNRAYAKAGMMNYTGAIDDFTESITLYAKDSEIFYQRGLMNLNINNRFDACKDFVKARDLGNNKAEGAISENCDFMTPSEK